MNNSMGQACELDSFYESRIIAQVQNQNLAKKLESGFVSQGFRFIDIYLNMDEFFTGLVSTKYDLLIFDFSFAEDLEESYRVISEIREKNSDIAIITISDGSLIIDRLLDLTIYRNLINPIDMDNLLKASKSALGNKSNYEIGMQFFDALFGMQMCTHKDLHQRTFDHVIRTTKIYAKFLLYLTNKGRLQMTSWSLKNCLMACLVHDIGKLLIMHGVLYKDGRLTDFEYDQVKQHPWNSVTALLGGQDLNYFINEDGPLETVSGYNEKNLGAQVRRWVFKIFDSDMSAVNDVEKYFTEMSQNAFVHSLNKDLLTIVFRHHDGIKKSYHSPDQLQLFSKLMNREVNEEMSEDSQLDIVTNALSVCDVFDALLDTRRSYRIKHYSKFFALYLLYSDMKQEKFFPFLVEEFIKYVMDYEPLDEKTLFRKIPSGEVALTAIKNIYNVFRIYHDQEQFFNDFLVQHKDTFEREAIKENITGLKKLYPDWIEYYHNKKWNRLKGFLDKLEEASLVDFDINNLDEEEMKTFDMLYRSYYSYSAKFKQKKLISYLVDRVLDRELTAEVKERFAKLITTEDIKNKRELEKLLIEKGYNRKKLLEVFKTYDENILTNELNDYLIKGTT